MFPPRSYLSCDEEEEKEENEEEEEEEEEQREVEEPISGRKPFDSINNSVRDCIGKCRKLYQNICLCSFIPFVFLSIQKLSQTRVSLFDLRL